MNPQHKGEIILYTRAGEQPAIEVRLDGETVWLTQQQIADLFGTTKQNISLHIQNVFAEGELDEGATVKEYLTVRQEGGRAVQRSLAHFNLDLIISVGYRVKSSIATQFRIWATQRLREYLVKGFTMDDERLKQAGGGQYWKELLDRIRDIRSSENVLYRQVLDLYATSVDYDPKSLDSLTFFKVVQNKLHYAAHGHTAAAVIALRANAGKAFTGLLSFNGAHPTKAEARVAKNYLTESELKRLNTADNAGSVSHDEAMAQADTEHQKYVEAQANEISAVERAYLDSFKQTQRKLEGGKP